MKNPHFDAVALGERPPHGKDDRVHGLTALFRERRATEIDRLLVYLDALVEKLVVGAEEALVAQEHYPDGAQGCAGGDEEHDDNLVFYRLKGTNTREELPGHHPGEAHDADHHHGIDKGDHPRSDCLLDRLTRGLAPRRSERE